MNLRRNNIAIRPCGDIASGSGFSFVSISNDESNVWLLLNPDGECFAKFSEPGKTVLEAKDLSSREHEAVAGFKTLVLGW
jgi:hypothetical protein